MQDELETPVLSGPSLRSKRTPGYGVPGACMYHSVNERHCRASPQAPDWQEWYLAALINCLLRLTEHKRSLAAFVI